MLNRRFPLNASKFRKTPCQTRWLFRLYLFTTEIQLLDSKGYTKKKFKNHNMHIPNLLYKNYKKILKKTKTTLTVTLYLKIKRNKYFSECQGQRNPNYKATPQWNERSTWILSLNHYNHALQETCTSSLYLILAQFLITMVLLKSKVIAWRLHSCKDCSAVISVGKWLIMYCNLVPSAINHGSASKLLLKLAAI